MRLRLGARSADIDLVIFDKDGTLVDIHAPWGRWAEAMAQRLSAHVPPSVVLEQVGWDGSAGRIRPETPLAVASVHEIRAVFTMILYEHGMGWTAASAAVRSAIETVPITPAPPVCALRPLFERLRDRGVKIAVVTSDDHVGVMRDLEPLGLLDSIDTIIGGDAPITIKPAPDAVLLAAEQTGVPPARIAVVGDSLADLAMGRAASVALTVGVLSGSGTEEVLSPLADVVVASVCALFDS